jgi:putative selenate reductase
MTDRFIPMQLPALLQAILYQLDRGHYFGIPRTLFHEPAGSLFETRRFGQALATPLGPAAGPHTQLAQNIAGAWLCGARYIELKTIQTLDELEVPKPCIDMQDEGYNCEWSQELKIRQSFAQYLDAWILVHVLAHRMQWVEAAAKTIFNMSVGYNLEGILQPNVQWFFEKMNHCEDDIARRKEAIAGIYPAIRDIHIPGRISNNITLSTMHGCPPGEIEKIGLYLIREKGLHTVIKLNPTLLGPEKVRDILNARAGYETPVPDEAFAHDLKYPDAKQIISKLSAAAETKQVSFGLKLTNTLESNNFRNIFGKNQAQMYMSGKALHPLAVNLAAKIRTDFPGIDISFSAGADCFNIHELLGCNLSPVTVSSDLLKPGGYGRLSQYLDNLGNILREKNYDNVNQLLTENPEENLRRYSGSVLHDTAYHKDLRPPDIKTARTLGPFDCIQAPCTDTCPATQDVPLYMHHTARGQWTEAFDVILKNNPFPQITGIACDHECQGKCTRIHYDATLAIREIKRYVATRAEKTPVPNSMPPNGLKAAIIGAGPAGLSCAWYLKLSGFDVDIYEEKSAAGGMTGQTIPDFRMTREEAEVDIQRIISSGIRIHYNTTVDGAFFDHLRKTCDFVFAGIGARKSIKAGIPGADAAGVEDPLEFLAACKQDPRKVLHASSVIVIGGGNTAMDVARTAKIRSQGRASVKIIYRRTLKDMPASAEEIAGTLQEGIEFAELLSPLRILTQNGRVTALECQPMQPAGYDEKGRRKVRPSEDKPVIIPADVIIPAIGQYTDWAFATADAMKPVDGGYQTNLPGVFVGGDARAGASNIISALADGRKAAEAIARIADTGFHVVPSEKTKNITAEELLYMKARRNKSQITGQSANGLTKPVTSDEQARAEAARCLRCDEICNICVTVCPNFANQSYETRPAVFRLQTANQDEQGNTTLTEGHNFEIIQSRQVFNIADFCNECGNCRTFCPTSGAPYKDKPKIHLSNESRDSATEGYFFTIKGDETILDYKKPDGTTHRLTKQTGKKAYTYESPDVHAELSIETLGVQSFRFVHKNATRTGFEEAAAMHILMDSHLPFIPTNPDTQKD